MVRVLSARVLAALSRTRLRGGALGTDGTSGERRVPINKDRVDPHLLASLGRLRMGPGKSSEDMRGRADFPRHPQTQPKFGQEMQGRRTQTTTCFVCGWPLGLVFRPHRQQRRQYISLWWPNMGI
jgi:hypothetical protein